MIRGLIDGFVILCHCDDEDLKQTWIKRLSYFSPPCHHESQGGQCASILSPNMLLGHA